LARKQKLGAATVIVKVAQVSQKYIPAKRIDVFQTIGVDNDFTGTVRTRLQKIQQLACRTPVKIAHQFQVQIFSVSMCGDPEI
jgi:hypothetical protein